jgi:hypothetical protein
MRPFRHAERKVGGTTDKFIGERSDTIGRPAGVMERQTCRL